VLTELADWQRASLRPWLTLGRVSFPFAGPLTALADFALLNLEVGEATEHDLRAAVERDAGRPVAEELILEHPFATIRALRAEGAAPSRRILLAAPYSGYATTVLSGLIAALLEDAVIMVTDWRDARLVPLKAGAFDLADQIRVFARLMRAQGPGLHVVALSQATVPALLAVAALAGSASTRRGQGRSKSQIPATLSLLGGPIDPRRNREAHDRVARST